MDIQQACVWATSKEHWDNFLNDPELARALDSARSNESGDIRYEKQNPEQTAASSAINDSAGQRIGARLRAYETPITDEVLRQSIR